MNSITNRIGMFPARLEALKGARAFLEAFCVDAGVGRQSCLKLNLVIEELFLNTVQHGHRGGSDSPVWISLGSESGAIRMTYEDCAPPFNPFAEGTREFMEALAGVRQEGGLGVLLANALATESEYAYLFGRNRIRIALAA